MITGPDFTDGPQAADDALRNVDNVYAMRDGRVLCCEDGFADGNRSYPNDGLYVYEPEGDADRGLGNDSDGEDEDNPGRGVGNGPGGNRGNGVGR